MIKGWMLEGNNIPGCYQLNAVDAHDQPQPLNRINIQDCWDTTHESNDARRKQYSRMLSTPHSCGQQSAGSGRGWKLWMLINNEIEKIKHTILFKHLCDMAGLPPVYRTDWGLTKHNHQQQSQENNVWKCRTRRRGRRRRRTRWTWWRSRKVWTWSPGSLAFWRLHPCSPK